MGFDYITPGEQIRPECHGGTPCLHRKAAVCEIDLEQIHYRHADIDEQWPVLIEMFSCNRTTTC